MTYQSHEVLDSIRSIYPHLKKLQMGGKLSEMVGILKGCGYSASEVNLLKDSVDTVIKIIELERKA